MALVGVNTPVRNEPKKVKLVLARTSVLHGIKEHRMAEQVTVLNHQLDARRIHVDDAARANVQVSDFAVAHLTFGQSDERAASLNQRVRIFAQQAVVRRLTSEGDGIGVRFGAVTPAVEDDQNEWFGTRQFLTPNQLPYLDSRQAKTDQWLCDSKSGRELLRFIRVLCLLFGEFRNKLVHLLQYCTNSFSANLAARLHPLLHHRRLFPQKLLSYRR